MLFYRHLDHSRFQLCSIHDDVDFNNSLQKLLPMNPSSVVRLVNAIGVCAIRRRIASTADSLSGSLSQEDHPQCNSSDLCLCDVFSAMSTEDIQWS